MLGLQDNTEREDKNMVTIQTNHGDIVLELNEDKAPKTVANFLQYLDDGFYTDTIFHRVIPSFMIQGGGFTSDFEQKTTQAAIENEAANGLKNVAGSIAMARTSNPDSATSQFFINVNDNGGLDRPNPDGHGYAVFGMVVKGMDVVDAIKAVKTGVQGPHRDVPAETVQIKAIVRGGGAAE